MNSFSKHNRDFYDKTSKQWLDQLAAIKGIYHHEDLVAIQPELVQLIARSTEVSILEIGSGYGRVAEWFVQNFPLIRYCGFDFSQVSIDYCQRRFSDFSNMQFTVSDITDRQRSAQALAEHDLVLWPWGGLLEVSDLEKRRALTNIFHLTKPGGQLLIELPKDLGTGEPLIEVGTRHASAQWNYLNDIHVL